MQSILPWIGIVILFLTGWAVVKKYQVNMVLLLGGLALNILAVAGGLTSFLPKNAAATGFVGFDFMELLRAISRTQIAGVGFIILVSGRLCRIHEGNRRIGPFCDGLRQALVPY